MDAVVQVLQIDLFKSNGLFYHNPTDLFPIAGFLVSFYYYYFIEVSVFNANSKDPVQLPFWGFPD